MAEDTLTLEELLRSAGPYFQNGDGRPNGNPSNEEVSDRLELFGRLYPGLPSVVQRKHAEEIWTQWLKANWLTPQPWRLVQAAIEEGKNDSSHSLLWLTDRQIQDLTPPPYLVGNHIPQGTLCVVYGPSGCGKTFLTLDLAMSVAAGQEWQGFEVTQGAVAYVLAEGLGGFGKRVRAWKVSMACDDADIRFLTTPVNFYADPKQVNAFIEDLKSAEPKLVVVDTLAQCMAGAEENSVKDMSFFIAAAGRIRSEVGATVLANHHTGKDGKMERGTTALRGAADTMIRVGSDGEIMSVVCDKQRDDAPFDKLSLRLKPFRESCVVRSVEGEAEQLTKSALEALAALSSIALEDGATSTDWEKATEQKHSTYQRNRKILVVLDLVDQKGAKYVITAEGAKTLGEL